MPPAVPKPIQLLDENLIHKIAAGEVVERPVSVVKELVENAIDAGATRIHVEIEKGGIAAIKVSDDGCGIPAQDLSLALKRHATSKIQAAEDLFSLKTLGFRGEALPSIAAVSRFRLESATESSAPLGTAIEVEEGRLGLIQEIGRPRGTTVTVRDLFYTVPARLKFLKRPETEWGHIQDLLTALALFHLDIEWRLDHNQKQTIFCPPTPDFRSRVLDLFGRQAFEALYPVERSTAELKLRGLISHPNFSQKSNRQIFVFVNGRFVQDRMVNHAVVSGYRGLLMTQQFPMVILDLQVKPDWVDVNVHPTKREVRFANSQVVHHLISETLRRSLDTAPWRQGPRDEDSGFFSMEGLPEKATAPGFRSDTAPRDRQEAQFGVQEALSDFMAATPAVPWSSTTPQARVGTLSFIELRVLGQLGATYLVCDHRGSLVLIDQHAAHERIGFERLKKAHLTGTVARQILLHPISFELKEHESRVLLDLAPRLEELGLVVECFGENSFVLKAVPVLLQGCDEISLIRDLVEQVEAEGRLQSLQDHLEHLLATMACHRQIRAGDRLHPEEMRSLLNELEGTPRSYHCPHGRPVMVQVEAGEIEKWFKRVL